MSETLYRANVLVCGGTGCEASGSGALYDAMAQEVIKRRKEEGKLRTR